MKGSEGEMGGREWAYKVKAIAHTCVFLWSRLLSMMDPKRPQAPKFALQIGHILHLFFFFNLNIHINFYIGWLCKGHGTCLQRVPC